MLRVQAACVSDIVDLQILKESFIFLTVCACHQIFWRSTLPLQPYKGGMFTSLCKALQVRALRCAGYSIEVFSLHAKPDSRT